MLLKNADHPTILNTEEKAPIMKSEHATISIVQAEKEDLFPILRLFDEAVIWLNQQGIQEQWGTQPFSESPRRQSQFQHWIDQQTMFVAQQDGNIIGSLALNAVAPPYVADRWETFPSSAYYLEAFTTSRKLVGQGVGRQLLQWAEHYTRRTNKTTIWLDCWNGTPALVNYYQNMGFVPQGDFSVQDWPGKLLKKEMVSPDLA